MVAAMLAMGGMAVTGRTGAGTRVMLNQMVTTPAPITNVSGRSRSRPSIEAATRTTSAATSSPSMMSGNRKASGPQPAWGWAATSRSATKERVNAAAPIAVTSSSAMARMRRRLGGSSEKFIRQSSYGVSGVGGGQSAGLAGVPWPARGLSSAGTLALVVVAWGVQRGGGAGAGGLEAGPQRGALVVGQPRPGAERVPSAGLDQVV